MQCPVCEKPLPIPDVAVNNAECYGSRWFTITCSRCKGKVDAYFAREVRVTLARKSAKDTDDWGN